MNKLEQVLQKVTEKVGSEALVQKGESGRPGLVEPEEKPALEGLLRGQQPPCYQWGEVIKKMERDSSRQGDKRTGISLSKRDSNLFPTKTVKQRNMLSREVVRCPSTQVFKNRLQKL